MIRIFDFESQNRGHLLGNWAIIRIVATAYPGRQVVFSATATHIAAQQEEMGSLPQTVSLEALPESLNSVRGGTNSPLRSLGAVDYLKATNLPLNTVILGACGSFIKQMFLDRPLHGKSSFDIVFHATISALGHNRSLISRVLKRDLFTIFQLDFPPQMRFVLLERAIEKNLRKYIRSNTKTAVLEHWADREPENRKSEATSETLQVAFVGGATQAKGFSIFSRAAARKNPCVAYHCIGSAPRSYDPAANHLFATPPQKTTLPQREFDAKVKAMDLICLPLDPIYYSWTASGTVADCIRFGVPLITIRNDVISDLEARYGRFGYVFDTADEIPDFLSKIDRAAFDSCRQAFEETLTRISRDRSISTLAKSFRLNDGI